MPLTVYGDGTQTRSFAYVSDTVEGLYRLFASGHATDDAAPMNLGSPTELTVHELAELVRALTGAAAPIVTRPLPADDPRQRRPDITRARERLGWAPRVALRDGLARTIDYFRAYFRDGAAVGVATPRRTSG